MAVMKVIEVMSNSDKSWEDATKKAVKHASKSVKGSCCPFSATLLASPTQSQELASIFSFTCSKIASLR